MPTLTVLFLILAFSKFYSIFAHSGINRRSGNLKFQNKDFIIENLDHDLGRLVKRIVKGKQNNSQKNNEEENSSGRSYFASEISGLENSINTLSHISSEITESLYNFISAFHVDQTDFPDSNEFSHFWSETVANKLQNNLIRQNNIHHVSINQIPSLDPFSNNFPAQQPPNFAPNTNISLPIANINDEKPTDNQTQNNSCLDGQAHQIQFNPEVPSSHFSGNDFIISKQTVNNNEISNKYKIPEVNTNDKFLINKDINGDNTGQVEYNEEVPNLNTTYEFNSNIYSSLI